MNIQGLDYNTQREKLILPEYGREVQNMVDYAKGLPTKAMRQSCAQAIVAVMDRMNPQNRNTPDYKQKLWDHLAIMARFELDIDYPYDISEAKHIGTKPQALTYPAQKIPVKHYGRMLFELFDRLKTMPAGAERDELTRQTANQMKRDLAQWSHGSSDNEKVADDLARFTDGVIQLDLDTFKFEKLDRKPANQSRNKKKK